MSQYPLAAIRSHHVVVVGWDEPLGTFFGQVFDSTDPEEPENIILWVGTGIRELETVWALAAVLQPYAVIPEPLTQRLKNYQRESGYRPNFGTQFLQALQRRPR